MLLLLLVSNTAMAQFTLSGTLTDEAQNPLEFAIVRLQLDSLHPEIAITDSSGYYEINNLQAGNYSCLFQYVSYRDTSFNFYLQNDKILNLQYQGSLTLPEAIVTAKKPVLQRQIDRIRFNVADTDISFGSSVWEVIEKAPLVNASNEGELSISGTDGAVVYINNRRKILAGEALKNYLNSIPSENLEAIEVITTPPSRYEAEGGAGIINIVMKKNKEEGLEGNAGFRTTQATLNSQAASTYLNYRQGKWNVYSSFYVSNRNQRRIYKKNIFYPDDSFDISNRLIRTVLDDRNRDYGASGGIDYEINKKHTIGMLFDYSGSNYDDTRRATSMDDFIASDSLSVTNNTDDQTINTYSANLNYQGSLNDKGASLNIDLDYLNHQSDIQSLSITEILSTETDKVLYNRNWFRSASPQRIENASARADFEWPINDKLSFEGGIKSSFSRIDNDLLFEDRIGSDGWLRDPLRSNLFRYDEDIHAVYAVFNQTLNEKWAYQMGVRMENTIAQGWLEGEKVVDRNYTNFFPTAFLKYVPSDQSSYVLAVSSRITRPSYWDVNPFRTYTTDNAYFEGNPFLLPARYYRQELNYTLYKPSGTYIFQLGASQLLDEFYALPYNPEENVIANRKTNYGNKFAFFQATTLSKQFTPWWKITASSLAAYILSQGAYEDVIIDNRSFLLNLSTNQTFTLSKEQGLSLTVIANNAFPVTIVNTRIGNRFITEVRLRKSMGRVNLSLYARDLFKSQKDNYDIQLNDLNIIDENYHDTRSLSFAISYSFGKSTVKDKRYRETGNSSEQQRLY